MDELGLRRNSLRYPDYDYSQSSAYFVTINTHNNQSLFGTVIGNKVNLSPPGQHVRDTWSRLEQRFSGVMIDEFIDMPNHLHGIIMTGTDPAVGDSGHTIGYLVNSFKNTVNAAWRKGVIEAGWPRYQGKLWHRDYYERIVRNEAELEAIREYIIGNPARWQAKREV